MKKIFFCAIIIFFLACVYFFFEREESPPQIVESSSVSLIRRAEEDVAEIIFFADGERTFMRPFRDELGRLAWNFSAAENYRVNFFRAHEKARPAWLLSAVGVAHENSDAVELAEFGLAPPALLVETIFFDGTRREIKLGSRTSDLQNFFAMTDGDPAIYLISAILGERLLFETSDLLDMSLPGINVDDAEYIRIAARGNEPIVLELHGEKREENQYLPDVGGEQLIMRAPFENLRLSNSRLMENLIHPLSLIRIVELADIHPNDFSQFGLENPALEIFFHAKEKIHWAFGDSFSRDGKDMIYIKVSDRPHVFVTEETHVAAIKNLAPLDIISRFLALVPIADVEKISIETREKLFEMCINHVADSFEIAPTVNGISVDADEFRTFFRNLISLIADAEIEPNAHVAVGAHIEPEISITFFRIENENTQLKFFDYNRNFFAVSVSAGDGGASIFATNRRALERLIERVGELT
ncbi:MAG: DUF4340 domain-containing protein [Defluviitaleaceae bacterium]|nr:DUF4340 domain-containing protein [Defluviitaleaceae bacterium]